MIWVIVPPKYKLFMFLKSHYHHRLNEVFIYLVYIVSSVCGCSTLIENKTIDLSK